MNMRPRASLGRVLDDLGATLLELVHGDAGSLDDIGGVVIHDPLDEPTFPASAVVLGVGLADPAEIAATLEDLAAQHPAALVVRSPVPAGDELTEAVARTGVPVLGLTRGASWAHLAALLRSILAVDDVGVREPESLGGMPSGDLFALANAIAALLDAPVTIEDRSSRVLAFSGRQDEADPARVATILGRQVPELYARQLAERGVFQQLYRADRPILIEPVNTPDGQRSLPRVAMAVRAGDEILGSIWAAVSEPQSAERSQALQDAAKLVALHLLRVRAGADVERRLRADLVGTALEGRAGAAEAISRLGLAGQPTVVLAVSLPTPVVADPSIEADAGHVGERQRLADALAMHLSAVHPRSCAALVGDTVYGLVPVQRDRPGGDEFAVRTGADFLERVGGRIAAVVGVSPVADGPSDLAAARDSADRAVRVLRSGGGRRVARLADVHVESLIMELRDIVADRGDQPTGPLARLFSYDRDHNARLVETLRAWLDAFGDVIAAAASVYVHPNTFRYRLRRLAEVGGIDLTDPEARFAAMLQLRVIATAHDPAE